MKIFLLLYCNSIFITEFKDRTIKKPFLTKLQAQLNPEQLVLLGNIIKSYKATERELFAILLDTLPLLEELQERINPDTNQDEAKLDHTTEQIIERITNLTK